MRDEARSVGKKGYCEVKTCNECVGRGISVTIISSGTSDENVKTRTLLRTALRDCVGQLPAVPYEPVSHLPRREC